MKKNWVQKGERVRNANKEKKLPDVKLGLRMGVKTPGSANGGATRGGLVDNRSVPKKTRGGSHKYD